MMRLCLNCIWCDKCNPGCDYSVTKEEMKHIAVAHTNPKCDDYTPIFGEVYHHAREYREDFRSQWHRYVEYNLDNFY